MPRNHKRFRAPRICPVCLKTRTVGVTEYRARKQLRVQCNNRVNGCGADVFLPAEPAFTRHYLYGHR